ncbi:MAG TPA: hypothetical protein VJA40_05490 [archaeon]|nr:hypothetical protein [archaeon]
MISEELRFACRYPFSLEASNAVKALGYSIEDVSEEAFKNAASIVDSIAVQKPKKLGAPGDDEGARGFLTELVVAKVIIGASASDSLKRGYARLLAEHAYSWISVAQQREVFDLLLNTFNVDAEPAGLEEKSQGFSFKVRFNDYLRFPVLDARLRLVNQDLSKGFVCLTEADAKLFLKNAAYWSAYSDFEGKSFQGLPARFAEAGRKARELIASSASSYLNVKGLGVNPMAFPPCLKALYDQLSSGVLPSHYGNVALASFLLTIGMPKDAIVELYKKTPKFNARVVEYQLSYLAGETARGKKFSPPACAKLQAWGLCVDSHPNRLCDKVRHPVTYYKRNLAQLKA